MKKFDQTLSKWDIVEKDHILDAMRQKLISEKIFFWEDASGIYINNEDEDKIKND